MRSDSTRGFTFYICVGPFAGFGTRREDVSAGTLWRLVLGWVSLSVATFDAEQFIGLAARALESREDAT